MATTVKSHSRKGKTVKAHVRKGASVSWKYGTGTGTGKVISVQNKSVTRSLKGATVTRHGSAANPAVMVKQTNGSKVLKLQSELRG